MECLVCQGAQKTGPRKGPWSYLRCGRCGLLSSSPIPSESEITEHYHRKFEGGNYRTAQQYADQYRRIHRQYVDWIGVGPGERILDIGCFTGDLLALLRAAGADVYGLELQTEAAEIASQKFPGRIFTADVFGDQFPQGHYDTITMMALIEHVTDPMKLLRRCAGLLAPGGRLFLETPDSGSLLARLFGRFWPPLAPVEHVHLFSRRSLALALEKCGFTEVRVRRHIKVLPIGYVHDMLSSFGPDLKRLFHPVYRLLGDRSLPFYVGEILVSARRVG